MMMTKALPAWLASALLAGPVLAQDGASLQRCRAMPEAAARLACYDAIPLAAATAAVVTPAATVSAPVAVQPKQVPAQFGLERKATELDQIESEIKGTFEGWDSRSIIRLANGQVWQIDDNSSAAYLLQNPKVKIRRGMMGAFYLEIAGANRSPRVRRIQ